MQERRNWSADVKYSLRRNLSYTWDKGDLTRHAYDWLNTSLCKDEKTGHVVYVYQLSISNTWGSILVEAGLAVECFPAVFLCSLKSFIIFRVKINEILHGNLQPLPTCAAHLNNIHYRKFGFCVWVTYFIN